MRLGNNDPRPDIGPGASGWEPLFNNKLVSESFSIQVKVKVANTNKVTEPVETNNFQKTYDKIKFNKINFLSGENMFLVI